MSSCGDPSFTLLYFTLLSLRLINSFETDKRSYVNEGSDQMNEVLDKPISMIARKKKLRPKPGTVAEIVKKFIMPILPSPCDGVENIARSYCTKNELSVPSASVSSNTAISYD